MGMPIGIIKPHQAAIFDLSCRFTNVCPITTFKLTPKNEFPLSVELLKFSCIIIRSPHSIKHPPRPV
jgi:hypothetical protein